VRRAIWISLAFHALVMLLTFTAINFSQVTYVPRQVYQVELVSAAVAEPAARRAEPKQEPVPVPPAPKPEKEEEKEEEMPAPPEKPKKKPVEAKKTESKAKTVPSTEVTKSDAPTEGQADTGAGASDSPVATGEMSFEGDFPFASYVSRMRTKIAATWRVPAGSEGVERTARVYFRVHRDGSVSHVAVEESSGLLLFDQSCQRAVLQSAPMPPLPREYADEYLGVHFGFVYRPTP